MKTIIFFYFIHISQSLLDKDNVLIKLNDDSSPMGIRNFDKIMDLRKGNYHPKPIPKITIKNKEKIMSTIKFKPSERKTYQRRKTNHEVSEENFRISNITNNKKSFISLLDICLNQCINSSLNNFTFSNVANRSFYMTINTSSDVFFTKSFDNIANLEFIKMLDLEFSKINNSTPFLSCANICKEQYKKYTFDYKQYIKDLENVFDSHPRNVKNKKYKIYFDDIKYAFGLYFKQPLNIESSTPSYINRPKCDCPTCFISEMSRSRLINGICVEEFCEARCENQYGNDSVVATCDYISSCTCFSKYGDPL